MGIMKNRKRMGNQTSLKTFLPNRYVIIPDKTIIKEILAENHSADAVAITSNDNPDSRINNPKTFDLKSIFFICSFFCQTKYPEMTGIKKP